MNLINIDKAQSILLQGGVVAIPTETVYGLGGWIKSEDGIKKIFSTKERPFFDPLIVHVDTIEKAKKLTSRWTKAHDVLAKTAWPGPLTLIAEKHPSVNPLITSGLTSVAIRCPKHDLTLKLLSQIEGGIAAPSANKFGKTSPTTSDHVFQEFGDTVPIIDGGASTVGIESTVIGITEKNEVYKIEIYRPGFYTAQMIKDILLKANIKATVSYSESPVAPGHLKHHYMPKIPLVIVPEGFSWKHEHQEVEQKLKRKFQKPAMWEQPKDAALASRELYQKMRDFDQEGYDLILTSRLSTHHSEEWLGIWNRLEKAKTIAL